MKKVFLILVFSLLGATTFAISNDYHDNNEIDTKQKVSCRKFTVELSYGPVAISTEVEVCCKSCGACGGLPHCTVKSKGDTKDNHVYPSGLINIDKLFGDKKIETEIVTITKSSVVEFDGYLSEVKLGDYKIITIDNVKYIEVGIHQVNK